MKTIVTILFTLFIAQTQAQYVKTDSNYYNDDWEKTEAVKATYKTVLNYLDTITGSGVISKYTITDTLISVINYSNIPNRIQSGLATEYYTSGQLKHTINYTVGKLNGALKTYYNTGQLKRQDLYKNDSLVTGRCYTLIGADTSHFPYFMMPEFPGGTKKLYEYLGTSISYPLLARDNGVQGTVYVSFMVSKTGQVSSVQILRGIGAGCDEESIKVVSEMPNWTPGYVDGIVANTWYNIPIKYSLSGSKLNRQEQKEKKQRTKGQKK